MATKWLLFLTGIMGYIFAAVQQEVVKPAYLQKAGRNDTIKLGWAIIYGTYFRGLNEPNELVEENVILKDVNTKEIYALTVVKFHNTGFNERQQIDTTKAYNFCVHIKPGKYEIVGFEKKNFKGFSPRHTQLLYFQGATWSDIDSEYYKEIEIKANRANYIGTINLNGDGRHIFNKKLIEKEKLELDKVFRALYLKIDFKKSISIKEPF